MSHHDNSDLIVCRTDWVDQDLANHDWQSNVLQSIDSEVSFEADRQAGSLTAQTYCQIKSQFCELKL